jgi:hypothetical protein
MGLMAFRECVCGCDREVPLPLTGINADAGTVQQELMEWDGFRHMTVSLANYADGSMSYDGQLDPFIDAGAVHYRDMLAVIHREAPAGLLDQKAIKRWIKFSRNERRKVGRGTGIVRTEKVLGPRPHDADKLDRLHPDLSFTGPDPDGRKLAEEANLLRGGNQDA